MSLVILSNEINENHDIIEPANKFRNYLTNTMTIKKNSQVAVNAVKIVKGGTFRLPRNLMWYSYFGPDFASDQFRYMRCILTNIRHNSASDTEVDVESMAEHLTKSFLYGFPYPAFQNADTKVTVKYDADNQFEGYDYKLNYNGVLTNQVPTEESEWLRYPDSAVGSIKMEKTGGAGNFIDATTTSKYNSLIHTKPLSPYSGVFEVGINDKAGWCFGLTTSGLGFDQGGGNTLFEQFNKSIADFTYLGSNESRLGTNMRDIFTTAFPLYSVFSRGEVGGNVYLCMNTLGVNNDIETNVFREVKYWRNNAGIGNTQIQLNGGGYDRLRIKYSGELIEVYIRDFKGKWVTLVHPSVSSLSGDVFKPVSSECWTLYPYTALTKTGIGPLQVHTVDSLDGVDGIYPPKLINNIEADYNARLISNGQTDLIRDLSSLFDITNFDLAGGFNTNTFTSYMPTLVMLPQDPIYTIQARGGESLGFANAQIVASWTRNNGGKPNNLNYTLSSAVVPKITNKSNLFVRLDNFNAKSHNGLVHRESKIIYALPRFSNSGQETGALFFEANEKTFIDLENPNDININEFDISIVNDNETLAVLTGKTVVVLYFREKPK